MFTLNVPAVPQVSSKNTHTQRGVPLLSSVRLQVPYFSHVYDVIQFQYFSEDRILKRTARRFCSLFIPVQLLYITLMPVYDIHMYADR